MNDYCAFDVDKASKLADDCYCSRDVIEEALREVGLEKMEPESHGKACGRLFCPCDCKGT